MPCNGIIACFFLSFFLPFFSCIVLETCLKPVLFCMKLSRCHTYQKYQNLDVFVQISNVFLSKWWPFFRMVGPRDFRFHLKFGPSSTQPLFDNSKSRQVQISDPHCSLSFRILWFYLNKPVKSYLYLFHVSFLLNCNNRLKSCVIPERAQRTVA